MLPAMSGRIAIWKKPPRTRVGFIWALVATLTIAGINALIGIWESIPVGGFATALAVVGAIVAIVELRGWKRWALSSLFLLLGIGEWVVLIKNDRRIKSDSQAQQTAMERWQGSITDKLTRILNSPTSSTEQKHAAIKLKSQIERPKLSLDAGDSLEPQYAFETRFILRNLNPLSMKDVIYKCQILNPLDQAEVRKAMPGLLPGITISHSEAIGPVGDLACGKPHSIYCDYSMDLFANKIPSPQIQIWIFYKYNNKDEKEGF
jgi:hypothetical protein